MIPTRTLPYPVLTAPREADEYDRPDEYDRAPDTGDAA